MFHHDSRDYATAASEAAKAGRAKLEETIHKGVASAESVIRSIYSRTITDRVAKTSAVKVEPIDNGSGFGAAVGDVRLVLHPNAQRQILESAGVPAKFADGVLSQSDGETWGAELISHNINEIFSHRGGNRNLLRSEGDRMMAFLSDKFRRIDSRPLLESFVSEAQNLGLVPVDGVGSDTKVRVRALLPQVFEPVPNEIMSFGVEWGNSDYGDGGHTVSMFMMRVWCTNMAVSTQFLRQVHLGKRLDDNIEYSDQTYRLDTQANASALRDTVRNAISPREVGRVLDTIRLASEDELKSRDAVEKKLKSLSQGDRQRVLEAFDSPDVINMPPGQTTWRLSNAISWIAQHKDNTPDKKIEMQKLAGELIPRSGEKKPVEV